MYYKTHLTDTVNLQTLGYCTAPSVGGHTPCTVHCVCQPQDTKWHNITAHSSVQSTFDATHSNYCTTQSIAVVHRSAVVTCVSCELDRCLHYVDVCGSHDGCSLTCDDGLTTPSSWQDFGDDWTFLDVCRRRHFLPPHQLS